MVSSVARSAKEDWLTHSARQLWLTVSANGHIDAYGFLPICIGTDVARRSVVIPPKRFVYVLRSD
jgi:hypothetical protein